MSLLRCYACGDEVPRELESCPSCGASQDATAKEVWQQMRGARRQQDLWRFLAVVGVVVGIVIGIAWSGVGGVSTMGRAPAPRQTMPVLPGTDAGLVESGITTPEVNDAFVRLINAEMRRRGGPAFEILAWLPLQPDGVLLELRPPTAKDPLAQWQLLDTKGREALMQFLTVTLLRTQIEAGTFLEGSRPFPPLVLQYRGDSEPLAIRHADGRIEIRPTRWDAAYQEFLNDLQQRQAGAPAAGRGAAPPSPPPGTP